MGLALWLVWPRRAKATREETMRALERLRAECAAAFADIAATVARVAVPESAWAALAGPEESADGASKVRQTIEQPLVLQAAMEEAAGRAAGELLAGGDSTEDLEDALQRFSSDTQVQQGTDEVQLMHAACMEGNGVDALPSLEKANWTADQLLETLRQLGAAKSDRLQRLFEAGAGGLTAPSGVPLGVLALRACAEAESEVWERVFPGDGARRCSFTVALEKLSSSDGGFRDRRQKVEADLEALAAGPSAAAAAIQMPLS